LKKELQPDLTSVAALHGRRQARRAFPASVSLAGVEDMLRDDISPYTTWAMMAS
jgi:hypothetical protein